jgi:hypothetical protein
MFLKLVGGQVLLGYPCRVKLPRIVPHGGDSHLKRLNLPKKEQANNLKTGDILARVILQVLDPLHQGSVSSSSSVVSFRY